MIFAHRIKTFPLLRELIYVLSAAMAVAIIFYFLFQRHASNEITVLKEEIASLSSNQAELLMQKIQMGKQVEKFSDLTREYEKMKGKIIFANEQVPSAGEVSKILQEILSPKAGLKLISVQTSSVEDKGIYLRLPLILRIRGDYPSLGSYLSEMESSKRLISIEGMAIEKEGHSGLLITLEMSAYLMKEDKK